MLYICPKWLAHIQSIVSRKTVTAFIPFALNSLEIPDFYAKFQSLTSKLIKESTTDINTNNIEELKLIESEALIFFSELFYYCNLTEMDFDERNDAETVCNQEQAKESLNKAYKFIQAHFQTNISIKQIAQQSGLSEYHLIHAFKKQFGITPHAMQISMRINQAKTLLKQGVKIASVANDVGFNDQSHLHRNFKKLVAATPAQYKKQL